MAEYVIIFLVLAFVAHEFYAMKKDEENRKKNPTDKWHEELKRNMEKNGTPPLSYPRGQHTCYTPPPIGGKCPYCGHALRRNHGTYGYYLKCTNRSCRYTHW